MAKKDFNPIELKKLADAIRRNSLADFFPLVFKTVDPGTAYKHNWHIDCISEHLQAVADGEIKRLIINVMPRSLKSMLTSIALPAFVLGREPTKRFVCVSFAQKLASRLSQDTRLVIDSDWYQDLFPETRIARGDDRVNEFKTTKRGMRFATSVGGTTTGEGGNFIIIDDPLKPDEALSDQVRNSTNQWIDQVLMSRLNDPASDRMVMIMQRVHDDDPTSHLLKKGNWHHLVLPAYTDKPIQIQIRGKEWNMEPGQYLHEERIGQGVLDDLKRDLGDYAFAGQYMQSPVPLGGGEIKTGDLQFYRQNEIKPAQMNIYILVDAANSKKKTSDFTAMVVIGLAPDNNYYVLDIIRDRLDPFERIEKLMALHRKWNALASKPPIVGYERYGMMTDIQYLQDKQRQDGYRFSLVELKGSMPKEERIRRFIPIIRQRRLYLPDSLMYADQRNFTINLIEDLINGEMATFPVSRYDDMLDALSRIEDPDLSAIFPRLKKPVIAQHFDGGFTSARPKSETWMDL